jgi:hypothetical protein
MRRRSSSSAVSLSPLLLFVVLAPPLAASQFDVVINEVHYHPPSGDPADEFIELCNRGGISVDLSGWSLRDGVDFVFPPGSVIEPKSYLAVSPDADHAAAFYGTSAVVGDYTGSLGDGGDLLTLHDAAGAVISRVHYGDGGEEGEGWPVQPDGRGPSLELIDPFAQVDLPSSWLPSLFIHGTPAAVNTRALDESLVVEETVLIGVDEVWRYLKGTAPYPAGWREVGFADGAWLSGPTGIGYADDDERTVLDDMENGYLSFAARKTFELTSEELAALGDVELSVDYDDGFVAYLNGVEVARANLGSFGEEMGINDTADGSHEAGTPEAFAVPVSRFHAGENILAVQLHNQAVDSSDASFLPRLSSRPFAVSSSGDEDVGPIVVNEVKGAAGGGPGFIELFNRSAAPINVSGFRLALPGAGTFTVPGGTVLAAGEMALFDAGELGFTPLLDGVTCVLLEGDGRTWVDGLATRDGGFSFGRFPDGAPAAFVMAAPTPNAANTLAVSADVVVSEIHFHPPFVPPGGGCEADCSDHDQWLELHNRAAALVDLSGWSLAGAVGFDFAPGTVLPAGGYLVVAASSAAFLAAHPGFAGAVAGDWARSLAHNSETVEVRDEVGNTVDRVRYGDGQPRNDEDGDDVGDRTFRGSEWPDGADATGRTLELRNPSLENALGGSWAASAPGGTPGAANSAFDAAPPPVVGEVTHAPAVPRSDQAVTVLARVSAVGAIDSVRALWQVDGGGPAGAAILRDDGVSGDGRAGDGVFAGAIPAQANGATIAFRVEASLAGGGVTVVPRAPDVLPYAGFAGPFFLYQVLNQAPPANPSPNYYLVMTAADAAQLAARALESNLLLPATFVSRPASGPAVVRHLAGVRYRGSDTRGGATRQYRVELPPERTFRGMEHLNLNASNIDTEILAADLFQRAGMPAPLAWTVNFTFRGTTNTRYLAKERLDARFLTRYFGERADGGNLYRSEGGDLSYLGTDPDAYRASYAKRNQREEDDYSDLVDLCRIFDPGETPEGEFAERLEEAVDVWQWARFFALQSAITNGSGGLEDSSGEDFFLYRLPEDAAHTSAGKWMLLPWDIADSYTSSSERLFRPDQAAIQRFLRHERFVRLYYCNLVDIRFGVFSRVESRQRFRLMSFLFGFGTIDGIDSYLTARIGFYDENIPTALSAGAESVPGAKMVEAGDTWSFWRGRSGEPSSGTLAWTLEGFDDDLWESGPSGFGYDDGDDATVLGDMEGSYTSVYIRRAFEVADPDALGSLELTIDWDDGFVAYLNGSEIARRNVAGTVGVPVPVGANAAPNHDAGTPERIDVSAFLDELVAGTNVLAVHGLNGAINSSDLSLIPELGTAASAAGALGCGTLIYATEDSIGLSGLSDACTTERVEVNGVEASYDAVEARWTAAVALAPGDNLVTIEAFDEGGAVFETLEVAVRRLPGAFTAVTGTLAGGATWSAAGGPYLMTGSVIVPAGATLTIEPGTIIYGNAGASIIVRGRIDAEGTEADPILLRAADCAGRWGGIAIDGTGTAAGDPTQLLRYCDFEYGDTPSGFAGGVAPVDSKILVDRSSFRFFTANAIDGTDSRVEVRDSKFESVHEGVHCTSSDVIVVGCMFRSIVGDKDSIDFDLNGTGRSLIERCFFLDGSDDGIDLADTTVDIRDNIFINIQDKALSLEGNGPLGPPTVTGNLLVNCGTAIALKNGVTILEGHHNTIIGSTEGINLFAKAGAANGGHGTFHSMVIWHNSFDVLLDSLSTVSFTHSDISDRLWPGEGNISLDPRFMDILRGDFSLQPGSPCIETGRGGTDMGAIPFAGEPTLFVRGDADGGGGVEASDVLRTLNFLFQSGPGNPCTDRMDATDDGEVDLGDPVFTLFYLYAEGPEPPLPFPAPGIDPTPDGLRCP